MSLSHLLLLLSVKACLLVDCGRIDSIIGRSDSIIGRSDSIGGRIDSSGGQIGGIVFNDEEDAILWRRDGRCGPEHLLPDGRPGQCDPNAQTTPKGPCCSSHGFCGHTTAHCNCPGCIDYRIAGGRKIDEDGVNFERSTPTPPKRPAVWPPTSQTEEEFSQKEEKASSTSLETMDTKSTSITPSTSPSDDYEDSSVELSRPTSLTNEYLACPTVFTIKTNVRAKVLLSSS